MIDGKTYFYFGHPKCGSTWLGGITAGLSIDMGLNFFYGQFTLPQNMKRISRENFDFVVSQNSDYRKLLQLNLPYKGFHVIRDPRDLCLSSYFSCKKTHPVGDWRQLIDLRDKLNSLTFDEGLIEMIKFNREFIDSMANWNYNDKNIYEIKFEELIQDPLTHLKKIYSFLGFIHTDNNGPSSLIYSTNRILFRMEVLYKSFKIKYPILSSSRVEWINKKLSFNKLSKGRRKGELNLNSHYRKGESGDWKNYFSEYHKDYFKREYGDILINLGYETDHNW